MKITGLCLFLSLALLAGGCSDRNDEAPLAGAFHPDGWILTHGVEANQDLERCQGCHGVDFRGSGQAVSCFLCHLEGPPFTIHPSAWGNNILAEHQHFYNTDLLSWTTCAVPACHGRDLAGGSGSGETGPSCFSTDYTNDRGINATCHASGPLPSHRLPYIAPADHGSAAKDASNIGENMLSCRNCHGRPPNIFNGGFVSSLLGKSDDRVNCSNAACHPEARAHPGDWQGSNDTTESNGHYSSHRTIDLPNPSNLLSSQIVRQACVLCHKVTAPGISPLPSAPSCFASTFEGLACHASGPAGANHVVPFNDPALHGPEAKSDLTICQECHGEPGGAGSNPRFNLPKGNLVNGCEDCHMLFTAHPDRDRWSFRGLATTPRRTHFAAGNILSACALCHGAALDGLGTPTPVGPTCFSCHLSAPLFRLRCTYCHGYPPVGAADLSGGIPVDHRPAATFSPHDECALCHGSKDDGSGFLVSSASDYTLFNRFAPALAQGGDHLDGNIEMNGPCPVTGAGYSPDNFGCDNACHPNLPPYQLSDSGLPVEFGNYGTGEGGCNICHGYPPVGDGTTGDPNDRHVEGATPVDHGRFVTGYNVLFSSHNECLLCHGNKDDGTGSHSPALNYEVSTDHNTTPSIINMNGTVGYNEDNFGCDAACHPNDAAHQLSDSGLAVLLEDYGGGGGPGVACADCHDSGAGGAPIVITNVSPHAGGFTCEDCHTGHAGPVTVPANPLVGINYAAGIAMGGAAAPGTTEAQICWNCHENFGMSEWGSNQHDSTGNSDYNYGQIFSNVAATNPTANWVGATWKSSIAVFDYKTGPIASTHSANPAATVPGVDAVADIRCSYCHDVHELALATGDTKAGRPYLRGTWFGNPYPEDGAPHLTSTYQNILADHFGRVPRGSTAHNETGGFQIDQNNGSPTSGLTANASAGLCELCHGNGDASWSAAEIDNLNHFGRAADDWVGTNGHSAAALGGSGSLAANIFRTGDRHTTPIISGAAGAGNPTMAYQHVRPTSDRAFGFRNTNRDDEDGWNLNPRMADNLIERPRGFDLYNWGATVDNTSTNLRYHRFSCSKCHNPHASRLPRLMITNCLDTRHNTWDDRQTGGGDDVDILPSTPSTAGTAISAENANVTFSNATSAQNCHRLKDAQFPNSRGSGWNRVTPW